MNHGYYLQYFCTLKWDYKLEYNGSGFKFRISHHGDRRHYDFGGTSLIDTLQEAYLWAEKWHLLEPTPAGKPKPRPYQP